jgi:metal-dependent amidase/aminoacylase/carboxypeptidase family protein
MVGLGCHDPNKEMQHGLHSPYFDFDETAMDVGTRLFGQVLTQYVEKHKL